ncbi:MAG: NADH-quinone oxidoreductase subunit C, partial [Nitrospira sp.]|nr:NADH-quinone oxidoreductase subunit C [Nitrospira sp.]
METEQIRNLIKERFAQHWVEREPYPEPKAPPPEVERPKPLPRSAQSLRDEVEIKPEGAREILEFLRNEPSLEFDFLHCISGIDYAADQPLGVTWVLTSIKHKHWIALNTRVDREKPVVPSVVNIWPAADWLERETYDLVGIIFDGHPDLKRILCAD